MQRRIDPSRVLVTPDGSRINEVMGRIRTGDPACSVAQIQMPPRQGQPPRSNGFRELMIVIDGSCDIELADETLHLEPGDVLDLLPNTRYAERGGVEGCTIWAICWPAFSPDLVSWVTH